jgi:hypothetical protein
MRMSSQVFTFKIASLALIKEVYGVRTPALYRLLGLPPYLQSLQVVFPAACCESSLRNPQINTPLLEAGMVHSWPTFRGQVITQ